MDPALFREFCDEFTREMNRLRMDGLATFEAARAEIKRIDRELDTLLDLILKHGKGDAADRLHARMLKLEARHKELQAALADANEPPPLLHPEMAQHYRRQVTEISAALREDSEARRMEAAEILRSLIEEIILTPEDSVLRIDLRGDLAGILSVATANSSGEPKRKKPPVRAAVLEDLIQQVEMVAGA